MEALSRTALPCRFGIFELDVRSGELRRHGVKVRLPDQAFQILRLLLARPGEVITREQLRQHLWTSDTFVDFDVGLNSAIRKLREALGDSAENPRFIETLPRRGYRFVASVTPAAADRKPETETDTNARAPFPTRASWVAVGSLLLATVATLAFVNERGWLKRSRVGTPAAIRSLAVLPFDNLTGDAAQDYFVDGMTDALTTGLAQVDGLQVTSRTSAMQYKRTKKRSPAIGQELNVDGLLEGAVVRSGQHVRITAQLIDAATDRHVWAQTFEGEVREVIALQQQIARAVAAATGRRLSLPPAHAAGPPAINPEAYDAYLKGKFVSGRGSYDGYRVAVAYFEEAVAKQPDFAVAYAAMAQAQHQFLFGGPLSPRETMPKAAAAARKALALDDTVAQAHQTLGGVLHHFYWQWEEGDKEFERARQLSAASPANRSAGIPALIRNGRFEEAIALSERARKDDPLSFSASMNVATAYRAAGQHDRAVAEIRRGLQIVPGDARGHFQLGVTFSFMGRLNDAIKELETAVTSTRGDNSRFQAYLGYAYAAAGRPLDARRIVKELESRARQQYVSAFGIALIYDALGEKPPALAAFERAYRDRAVEFAQMSQYPPFKTIASDPRYQARMHEIGLPR